jgi:hypothetical protein
MRARSAGGALVLASLAWTTGLREARLAGADPGPGSTALAVESGLDSLARRDLWPGFDALKVPLAIYDGERTFLFRHPAAPEGFVAVPDHPGVSVYDGRHPAVTANSSATLGGVPTATLMLQTSLPAVQSACIMAHETFHVFQRARHPAWAANEADLFVFPTADAELLERRRLESEALQRALDAPARDRSACWARAALAARLDRYARMPAAAAQYERATELNEGLANYVQHRAAGDLEATRLPPAEFAPEEVRQRCYAIGLALGVLLDRFQPEWRNQLEGGDTRALDELLAAALHTDRGDTCALVPVERESLHVRAERDARALGTRLAELERSFMAQEGWRLVVRAGKEPLFPQGFDPLNVRVTSPGKVLHARYLKLGNGTGGLELVGRGSLTDAGAGAAHPLFNGVRTLTVTGLAQAPEVTAAGDSTRVKADGVTGGFRGAVVKRSGKSVTLELPR